MAKSGSPAQRNHDCRNDSYWTLGAIEALQNRAPQKSCWNRANAVFEVVLKQLCEKARYKNAIIPIGKGPLEKWS